MTSRPAAVRQARTGYRKIQLNRRTRYAALLTSLLLSGCNSPSASAPTDTPTLPVTPSVTGSSTPAAPDDPHGDDSHAGSLNYTPGPSAPPAGPAVQLAERFAQLWVRSTIDAATWARDLAPLCTARLAAALQTSDPTNGPSTTITGKAKAVQSTHTEAVFHVPTRGGTLVVGTINITGTGWRVARIDFRRPGQ